MYVVKVVRNWRVDVGVEGKVNPDVDDGLVEGDKDGGDEIAEDEDNIV